MFDAFKSLFGDMGSSHLSFEKDWMDFRVFAIRRHGEQKYGSYPYALHLAMVENYLSEFGFKEYHYQAAAWLHDVLEDTRTVLDDILNCYGGIVASIVYSVSGEGATRKERNANMYERVAKYPLAAPVKVADRISNLTISITSARHREDVSKLKMYLNEAEEFRANIFPHIADSKRGLLLWEALESTLQKAEQTLQDINSEQETLNANEAQ